MVHGVVLICPALPDADGRLFTPTLGTQLRLAATRALLSRDDTGRRYVRRVIGRRREEVLGGRLQLYADGSSLGADAIDGYLRPMRVGWRGVFCCLCMLFCVVYACGVVDVGVCTVIVIVIVCVLGCCMHMYDCWTTSASKPQWMCNNDGDDNDDASMLSEQAHDWDVGMLETMRAFSLAGRYEYARLPQPVLTVQGQLDEPLATQARKVGNICANKSRNAFSMPRADMHMGCHAHRCMLPWHSVLARPLGMWSCRVWGTSQWRRRRRQRLRP